MFVEAFLNPGQPLGTSCCAFYLSCEGISVPRSSFPKRFSAYCNRSFINSLHPPLAVIDLMCPHTMRYFHLDLNNWGLSRRQVIRHPYILFLRFNRFSTSLLKQTFQAWNCNVGPHLCSFPSRCITANKSWKKAFIYLRPRQLYYDVADYAVSRVFKENSIEFHWCLL